MYQKRARINLTFEVNIDPISGTCDNWEDFSNLVKRALEQSVPHYLPVIVNSELDREYPVKLNTTESPCVRCNENVDVDEDLWVSFESEAIVHAKCMTREELDDSRRQMMDLLREASARPSLD